MLHKCSVTLVITLKALAANLEKLPLIYTDLQIFAESK